MTCFLTSLIKASKATDLINSSFWSIFSLNLLKYAHVDSPFYQATLKSYVEFFLAGMLVLKRVISFVQRSLNPLIELGSKLYQACIDCPNSFSWKYSPWRVECSICIWTKENLSTNGRYRHSPRYAHTQIVSQFFFVGLLGA